MAFAFSASVGDRQEPVLLEYEMQQGSTEAIELVLSAASSVMRDAKYELSWVDADLACYVRTYRPGWRIILAIVLAPLGLLLLFWTATRSLLVQILPSNRPRLVVTGSLGHTSLGHLREALSGVGEERRPAGWYSDERGVERYWDGETWTDLTRPERVVVGPRMRDAPRS